MNQERSSTRYLAMHLILTLLGFAGTAGVFLPFVAKVSPWRAIVNWYSFFHEWRFALPALLAILASAGTIRWLISGSLSVPERIISYLSSASMMVLSLSIWLYYVVSPISSLEWLVLSVHLLTLALGIGALIWSWRIGGSRQFSPVISIQVVYVAHVAMCLTAFFGIWEVGAYFLLVAALAFAIQIVLVLVEGTRRAATIPAR